MSTLQLSRGEKIQFYPLQNRVSTIGLRRDSIQRMAETLREFSENLEHSQCSARLSVVVVRSGYSAGLSLPSEFIRFTDEFFHRLSSAEN